MKAKSSPRVSGPQVDCQACGKKRLTETRRGLCPACYQVAYRAITAGKTTWDELEKSGLCAPATPRVGRSAFARVAAAKLGRPI